MLSKIIQQLKRAGGAELKRRDRSFEVESDPIYVKGKFMKIFFMKMVLVFFAIFVSQKSEGKTDEAVCRKITDIYARGLYKKYEVPYEIESGGVIRHDLKFKGDRSHYVAISECGAGSAADAECEIQMLKKGRVVLKFSLPTHVGFVNIEGNIYLVNGLAIDRWGIVEKDGFMVHQLLSKKLKKVCPNL